MTTGFYIAPGYFEDGYIFSPCPVVFTSGASRLDLSGPSTLGGSVRMLQPQEYSSGWQRIGFSPLAIVHTLNLQYNRLNGEERDSLDAFFDAVDFSARQFTYTDAATGNQFPVQFQTPEISLEEVSYDLYRTSLSLWSAQTFFSAPAVPATISTLLNAAHYPEPVKRAKKQPLTRLSDGSTSISNKSTITRLTRTCSLIRISRDDLASLIAHFIAAGGIRDWWTWTTATEERTCRYASSQITWQRSSVRSSTYDAQVSLEEDFV